MCVGGGWGEGGYSGGNQKKNMVGTAARYCML